MAKRRLLVERVAAAEGVDPALAEDFIYGRNPGPGSESQFLNAAHRPTEDVPVPEANEALLPEPKGQGPAAIARAPLTTRVRADYAAALKRASLERQLKGVFPQTVQDILEAALEPWLRGNGYLS
jgi:hypothetical protein